MLEICTLLSDGVMKVFQSLKLKGFSGNFDNIDLTSKMCSPMCLSFACSLHQVKESQHFA